ncbi:MAG: gamma-butyrobetaine hydroxylase-like domain-containing protein [Dongiaceae bacterium]
MTPNAAQPRLVDRPWPVEIKLKKSERILWIAFNDGLAFSLGAELLRVYSPSAEAEQIAGGKKYVAITQLEPVGNYALRPIFDDGHTTGIYTWDYLYELGANAASKWREYEEKLAASKLSRE